MKLLTLTIAAGILAGCGSAPPVRDHIADEKLNCEELAAESKKMSQMASQNSGRSPLMYIPIVNIFAGAAALNNQHSASEAQNRADDLLKLYWRKKCK